MLIGEVRAPGIPAGDDGQFLHMLARIGRIFDARVFVAGPVDVFGSAAKDPG